MKLYLSAEAQAGAAGILSQFNRIASKCLEKLEIHNYGAELTEISIITILVRKELYDDGGYPERRVFMRKSKSADIRLRMDFNNFLSATPEKRYDIYCQHIRKSVETLRNKVSASYQFDQLQDDIQRCLEEGIARQEFLAIRRLP